MVWLEMVKIFWEIGEDYISNKSIIYIIYILYSNLYIVYTNMYFLFFQFALFFFRFFLCDFLKCTFFEGFCIRRRMARNCARNSLWHKEIAFRARCIRDAYGCIWMHTGTYARAYALGSVEILEVWARCGV
jgi:hypothetical protein